MTGLFSFSGTRTSKILSSSTPLPFFWFDVSWMFPSKHTVRFSRQWLPYPHSFTHKSRIWTYTLGLLRLYLLTCCNFKRMRNVEKISINYHWSYVDWIAVRPIVQMNTAEMTIKLLQIGHTGAGSLSWTMHPLATFLLFIMCNVNIDLQAQYFAGFPISLQGTNL